MPKCVVVADDLTGANATGVLLKRNGFDTLTLLRQAMDKAAALSDCDCLVFPTDSRAIPAEEAYGRVRQALELLSGPEVIHYAKRIDSTLRGNLGRETDAFLDVLGPAYTAVCVPCFPSSGRVLIGSHMLVNGVPLRHTEAAADPMCPISCSDAMELFRAQTVHKAAAIHLDEVHNGAKPLAKRIAELREEGARILLVDSVTMEDMETVADALVLSGTRTVSVDPGPFTAVMASRMLPPKLQKAKGKVFCAIGSVNGVAGAQTRVFLDSLPVEAEYLDVAAVLESDDTRDAEVQRIVDALLPRAEKADILAVVGCGIDPARRVPFEPYMEKRGMDAEGLSGLINDAFAQVTMKVLAAVPAVKGVYSTGGDITCAIQASAGTVGLRLLDEVVPLAAYGIAMGGALAGTAFVSKGGMVGDKNAIVTCVRYLQDHFE